MIMPNPSSDRYCDHFAASSLLPSSPGTLFGGTAAAPLSALQVIVQLTTIHLTPDKPRYDGGEWRVEGQLNEHIVATALFFYDADNVTNGALAFRTAADREKLSGEIFYENGDLRGIERAFAINAGGSTLQDIGEVSVRPGRALFYPNLYQHRVGPFALADPTRPGHRKVLALHLVDPRVPVLSTANVPPQQRAWWAREVGAASPEALLVARGLPGELRDLVLDGIGQPVSREEAREIREDLMADHKALAENNQSCWDQTEFHFSEY